MHKSLTAYVSVSQRNRYVSAQNLDTTGPMLTEIYMHSIILFLPLADSRLFEHVADCFIIVAAFVAGWLLRWLLQ